MTAFAPIATRIDTERLVMTPETLVDAEWLARLFTERGAGTVTVPEAEERVRAMQAVVAEHGIGARVLRMRDGGTPLGYCAVVVGRATLAEPEIAYELLPEAQGHGYATEGARALLDATWRTGRTRVWSTIRATNVPSLRVIARLGFRQERVTVDERGEIRWFTATAEEGRA
jgi:RimJ/RimL family protein N-acetyltransferase